MRSGDEIEETSRGVISGSAEEKGLTESEKCEIELRKVREDWKQVLLNIEKDKIRHTEKLAEIRAEARAESRHAAESERRRCRNLERKIAEIEEIVEARETLTWLRGTSPTVQKGAIEEDSDRLVTLQPNEEGEQEVYEIENLLKEGGDTENASDTYSMVIPHRWTVGAVLILLGMVYLCSASMPEPVGTHQMKGMLKCWEDTPVQVSGRLPISWKVTEAVGTITWCTWKELRDPGYQLEGGPWIRPPDDYKKYL